MIFAFVLVPQKIWGRVDNFTLNGILSTLCVPYIVLSTFCVVQHIQLY